MGIISKFIKSLISGAAEPQQAQVQSGKTVSNEYNYSEKDKIIVQMTAESALRVFTESLDIANKSKNLATRESRLRVARENLNFLKELTNQHPFLHLENLQAVEVSINEVEAETQELIRMQNASLPIGKTIGELQDEPLSAWGNDDIIEGLKFSATMQLRTPLRVLLRHGEMHTDRKTAPPKIINEMWEGIWTAKTKSYEEIVSGPDSKPEDIEYFRRIDADLEKSRTVASDIGPIHPSDYLPFLISIRKIVELDETINNRIKKLRELPILDEWKTYVKKHGGKKRIIGYFFPRFIDTIPTLNLSIKGELSKLRLHTPNRIAAASDEMLLGIKGIGNAKLKTIRGYCADITENRDADRIENVIK